MMTPAEIRLNQNPILTNLLLGMGQGDMIAEKLFPRLPQVLSSAGLIRMGNETLKRHNLRRAPGTATKRVEIKYEGQVYTVEQYAVEVPIPRELIRESDYTRRLNVGDKLDISAIAINTSNVLLGLDYELDVAGFATDSATYASGHVAALSGADKWSASTGKPVTDIRAAANIIRKKIGKKPNKLALSADAKIACETNAEVKSFLPTTQMGVATLEQMAKIFEVEEVIEGNSIWVDGSDVGQDVWGNNAILAYVPKIQNNGGILSLSLTEPAFGFTNVIEGHPFAETPYYQSEFKSWIYGATYERKPNVAYNTAGFLFQNPK